MRETLDKLISERAPWLDRPGRATALSRDILYRVLRYENTVRIAEALAPLTASELMGTASEMFAHHVEIRGLHNLPATGAALIVCNHPTGIADGIALYRALAARRPDMFFFANADAIRVFPQLGSVIAPVEWRVDKRSHRQNRETLSYAHTAFVAGRLGVVFPSGRLAKRRWLSLHERSWMPSAAMLARRYHLPVVPLHITARNSALFYLFDRIHPTLRDITLFHEVLNKTRQPYRLTMGVPIAHDALPTNSTAAIEFLRARTLELGGERPQTALAAPRQGNRRPLDSAHLTS